MVAAWRWGMRCVRMFRPTATRVSGQRTTLRWTLSVVIVTLLAVLVTNVQGGWVYADTSNSGTVPGTTPGTVPGTVPSPPAVAACGGASQQFGFLDADGNSLDSINLNNPGESVDIQVCVDGLTLGGPDTVQVVIEHDDSVVELINPVCTGLLSGGFASPSTKRTADDQASAFICSKPGGVSGAQGAVLGLTVKRTGFGTETLSFRTSGALSTRLYESGTPVTVSSFASLLVQQLDPSVTPTPTTAPSSAPFIPPPATATPVPAPAAPGPVLQLEPPTEPTEFVAQPALFSIVLTWEVPEDTSGRPVDFYEIQNLKTGEIVRVDGVILSYTFSELDPAFEYSFTIKAATGLGTGNATGAGPVRPWALPGPPTAVGASIQADGSSVLVTWTAPASDGGTPITGYSVTFTPAALTGATSDLVREATGTELLAPDLLQPGNTYTVSVSANTAAGTGPAAGSILVSRPPESSPSPTVSAVPPTVPTAVPTVIPTVVPTVAPTVGPTTVGPGTGGAGETVSVEITITENDGDALETAIEAITGDSVQVDRGAVTTEPAPDGLSIAIAVAGLSEETALTGPLNVQIGSLSLAVADGNGTAEIQMSDEITVSGSALVTAGQDMLEVQITDSVLLYSPDSVDDGSFAASATSIGDVGVSFEVGLGAVPDAVGLATVFSADPVEFEAAVGTTFALTADSELAYFVSVEKSGVTQGELGDNTVTMSVSPGWLDEMVSQGLEIAITKVSDDGVVFTELAQCERSSDRAVCTVTFTGAAGGFSVFAIYGFVNPDPVVAPQPLAVQGTATVPDPAATLEAAVATEVPVTATPVAGLVQQAPAPTPEIAPVPTETGQGADGVATSGVDEGGGGGPNVLVIVAIAAVAVVAGGSVLAVFMRRPEVPTVGLVIFAVAIGSVGLVVADSSVVRADGDGGDLRQVNIELPTNFNKNDFRYRKVGSEVRTLSEAYRAGTLGERPDFSGLSGVEALDPSIDVSIWFESPEAVDLKLISQMATVLNSVDEVVEARVPVRFAHQLSYIPGVLRVDRITPPQVGAITSEGAAVHGSPAWNTVGLDGTGIKVGIIDVGFQGWRSISPSELPTPAGVRCYTSLGVFTSNLSDCETETIHGAAVAEAVDDVAPGVEFYISNPKSSLDLLSTTQWMASQGVQIINHSVGWIWDGPGDGTSPKPDSAVKSVDQAVADGILWVNAAGNSASQNWYGPYSDIDGDQILEFGSNEDLWFVAIKDTTTIQIRWQDDWSAAATDLALWIWDPGILAWVRIDTLQSGQPGQLPTERVSYPTVAIGSTYVIAVTYVGGPLPDWVQVSPLSDVASWSTYNPVSPAYSISNPAESANPGMLAVGAAAWSSTSTIESFSSQGPTTDGRVKPDIVGADKGNSVSYGFDGFSGTSQASPHVAGLAALVLQRFPLMKPTELATYLKSNAAARGTVPNNTWGYGFAGLTAPAAPSAVGDSYTVDEDTALSVSAAGGVLSNDSDDDNDVFTSALVASAPNGSVSLNPDGSFTYTPNAEFNGADSFTYKTSDPWQESSTVSVGLTVNPIADVRGTSSAQGAADPNDVGLTVVGAGVSSGSISISAGPDGAFAKQVAADTFTFTASAGGYVGRTVPSQSVLTADVALGATQLRAGDVDGDGDVDSADASALLAGFVAGLPVPASRVDGSGNYVDLNGDGTVDAIDVSLWASNYSLTGPMAWDTVATTPPLAIADSYLVYRDTQLLVSGAGVLGNDFDEEGDSLTAAKVGGPSNGSLALNPDGSFTYDPKPGFVGVDSFTYTASDSQTTSIKVTVEIDVRPVPTPTPTPTPTLTPTPTPTPSGGTTVGTTAGTTAGG